MPAIVDVAQIGSPVPGRGRLIIATLGRGDVMGVAWLLPPYQWRFGAVTTQPMQAYEFDARAVRAACDEDPSLGYELGRRVSAELRIPTVGIGAGPGCDAQILVWQDMAGLTAGRLPRFVKRYADLRADLLAAAGRYVADVADGRYPGPEHSYA